MRWITLALLSLASVLSAQEIWWARTIHGDRSQIWVYGKDLWWPTNGEADTRYNCIATIEPQLPDGSYGTAQTLVWDNLAGANQSDDKRDDPHRASDRLHRYWFPGRLAGGVVRLTVTRPDGKTATAIVTIPAYRERFEVRSTRGEYREWSQAVVVGPGQTLDLGGNTVAIPSAITLTAERSAIVMQSGSRLTNGTIIVPESYSGSLRSIVSVRGPVAGIQIDAVRIEDRRPAGMAFWGGDEAVRDSLFANCELVADTVAHCNLFTRLERNTFYHVDMSGPRGWRAGNGGRMASGAENLFVHADFHDIDRGWGFSSWGSPISRNVWFECDTILTGRSNGASEGGLVFEPTAFVAGQGATADRRAIVLVDSRIPSYEVGRNAGPGRFLIAGNQWARIESSTVSGYLVNLTLDRAMTPFQGQLRYGNVAAENLVDRCRYENGRSAIWFFGDSIGNDLCQLILVDLREPGIQQLVRPFDPSKGFFPAGDIGSRRRFIECVNSSEYVQQQ